MGQISRVYSFNDVVPLLGSQVETEIFNIVNTWNNFDSGTLGGTSPSFAAITFYNSAHSLISTIKYTINNFTIIGDSTNGVNIFGNGGNISLGETSGSYGSGSKVVFIPDRSAAPSGNPTAGCIIWSDSGRMKSRSSGGFISFMDRQGTATNDSAIAGEIGETVAAEATSAAPTSTQYGDLTSISLTAGDWLVSAVANVAIAAANTSNLSLGISTTTGNSATGLDQGDNLAVISAGTTIPLVDVPLAVPAYRVSLASTTTHYLKMLAIYSAGAPSFDGRISAVRIR